MDTPRLKGSPQRSDAGLTRTAYHGSRQKSRPNSPRFWTERKQPGAVGRPAGPGAGAPKAGGLTLPASPRRGRQGRGGGRGEPHGHHRSSAPGRPKGSPSSADGEAAPAGGTPAGGKAAAGRSPGAGGTQSPAEGRAKAPGREPPGPKPDRRPEGRREGRSAGRGAKGGPGEATRCTRPKAARSKADRTGRPQQRKAGAKGSRGQRAPAEPRQRRTRAERISRGERPTARPRRQGAMRRTGAAKRRRAPRAEGDPRRGRGPGATGDPECAKRRPKADRGAQPQRVWARDEARAHAGQGGAHSGPGTRPAAMQQRRPTGRSGLKRQLCIPWGPCRWPLCRQAQ